MVLLIYHLHLLLHTYSLHSWIALPCLISLDLIWKVMMSCHLKALGYKVYLAITKESYLSDSRHIVANALALKALRASLHKNYLHVFSHYESAFVVWSILTSSELPTLINKRGDLGETSSMNIAS